MSFHLDLDLPEWALHLSRRGKKLKTAGRQKEGVVCLPPLGKCVFSGSGHGSFAEPCTDTGTWLLGTGVAGVTQADGSSVSAQSGDPAALGESSPTPG